MANVTNGNSVYVDSTGALDVATNQNIKVAYIIVTSTAASAVVQLQDDFSAPVNKIDFRVDTADKTLCYDFADNPLTFPNGIRVSTLTNATLTLILQRNT